MGLRGHLQDLTSDSHQSNPPDHLLVRAVGPCTSWLMASPLQATPDGSMLSHFMPPRLPILPPAGSTWEQDFVRQVIELHDKYMQYVIECFANSSLFHKALKEAFESFCNKQVVNNTSAELMANFCDNLLKKVGILARSPTSVGRLDVGHEDHGAGRQLSPGPNGQ